jgi:hypothetical protein
MIWKTMTALANEKILDGFGHVSVRDPRNPSRYLMSRSIEID